MRLEGQVTIITGVSHAGQVGYALAAAFAREGALLSISARTASRVHARAEELRTQGARVIAIPVADKYQQLRISLGKPAPPLNVIVTARGEVRLDLPVFQSGEVPVLLITTTQGAEHIRAQRLPPGVELQAIQSTGSLSARSILQVVSRVRQCEVTPVEGGPQLMGDFFIERALDELFLTLAPQIADRDRQVERPGLVMGKRFAPEDPLWGTLKSVKPAGSHLFLRYAFATKETTI
jgi:riboflavin biosynthesis pyrimidine reductase